LFRLDQSVCYGYPEKEKWASDYQSVEIPAKEIMDKGKRVSMIVIRPLADKRICPLTYYLMLKRWAKHRGLGSSLWGSEQGRPFATSASICRLLKNLLLQAGIPPEYSVYSIRHATITALFKAGLSELQVNAYTGHSNRSHTVASSYFHLDDVWAGVGLSSGPVEVPVEPGVVESIKEDNQANIKEEGWPTGVEDE
jgi:hypothetical protein